MSWRDRNDKDGQYHDRWSDVARDTDPIWEVNKRPRSPVWDMRKVSPRRSRSNERIDRNKDDTSERKNDRRDRHDRNKDRSDRNNDRPNRNNDRSDNRFGRYNDRNTDRVDRNNDRGNDRSDRNDDRTDRNRYDQRNYNREERSRERQDRPRDRDRRDRRNDERSSSRQKSEKNDEVPKAPSPPKLTANEIAEIKNHSEVNRGNITTEESQEETETGDWICQCGAKNFRFRNRCYIRACPLTRSEGVVQTVVQAEEGLDESSAITKRLLFRRLDPLTTEDKILEVLKDRLPDVVDKISKITIGRDPLTGVSRGTAFITFNSLIDSSNAYRNLLYLSPHLRIDSRDVLISYCKSRNPDKPKSTAGTIIDYGAYYAQAGAMADYTTLASMSQTDGVNAAAAVAQLAITAAQARNQWAPLTAPVFAQSATASTVKTPNGKGNTKFSPPDVRTFLYDETSGYYYDPSTGLYYDATTQYFYNNQLNMYMYWDAELSTYTAATESQQNTEQPKLPAPPLATADNTISKEPVPAASVSVTTSVIEAAPVLVEEKKKPKDKDDKVKIAKKIAKDMERWAKTLNQKKENARSGLVMEQPRDIAASKGSADIGFSVLGHSGPAFSNVVREITPPPAEEFLVKHVEEPVLDNDEGIIDWSKLTCLLCKRRFPSADVLTKHKNMSDLHKQNLDEYRKAGNNDEQTNAYRDRAAERRMKFGDTSEPVRKRYEPPIVLPPPVQSSSSVVDTIGGKMLQKMGWTEGRGLGKAEQGRTAPIEAEKRPQLAGLGQKRGIYTAAPGETYRDTVKKLAIARYNDLLGEEE